MTKIAFADHHTGEKRTDRCGKADKISGECRAERQHQNGKEKEIGRVRSGNPSKPCSKNRLANEGSDAECDRRYSNLAPRPEWSLPATAAPPPDPDEKRKDGGVLEQQDSGHETALLTADVALVDQLLERDGGR